MVQAKTHTMKTIQYTLLLLFLITMGSCSKEKRTERKLHRVGTWYITELTWTIVSQSVTDSTLFQGVKTGSEVDAGTFTFNKNGHGLYDFTYDGITKSGNIIWSTDKTESVSILESIPLLTALANLFSFSNGTSDYTIHQESHTYDLTRTERNVFEGDGSGVMQYVDASSATVAQYAVTFNHIKMEK